MGVKCCMPCAWRTYGKYRRTRGCKVILNKNYRNEGTCTIVASGGTIKINKDGKCTHFTHWDEFYKTYDKIKLP